jgi:hypothetical protein
MAKTAREAVRANFGRGLLIRRCRRRQERGVIDHEPERLLVQCELHAALIHPDADGVRRRVQYLARRSCGCGPESRCCCLNDSGTWPHAYRVGIGGIQIGTVGPLDWIESMIEIVRQRCHPAAIDADSGRTSMFAVAGARRIR